MQAFFVGYDFLGIGRAVHGHWRTICPATPVKSCSTAPLQPGIPHSLRPLSVRFELSGKPTPCRFHRVDGNVGEGGS